MFPTMQSSRLAYKAVRLACALSFAIPSPVHASILDDPATLTTAYVYEARMGPLVAGELNFDFQRADADYRFLGRFVSSRSLSKYYTWNGTFAAEGNWREQRPKTKTYLVQSESTDDDYKVVIMGEQQTQVLLERGGEFVVAPKPPGDDLISALMFTPGCYAGRSVHDGEDAYSLRLVNAKNGKLPGRRGFYSGPVLRCDYVVKTRRGNKRRLRVSLAEIDGVWVAAEVRVRLALLPDPMFRLRD